MGSHQFEMEYVEYLQARNSELVEKLSQMKEIYENKVCSQDLIKLYFSSGIQEILNLCTTLPEEIDLFFDEMTAAMNRLKSILLKKSEMVQLVDKISQTINGGNNVVSDKNFSDKKRNSTVKVSPMINGHVISTVPRIYLNRVSNYAATTQRNVSPLLSPIIETSPASSDKSVSENVNYSSPTVSPEKKSFNKSEIKPEYQVTPKQRLSKRHSMSTRNSDKERTMSPKNLITLNQGDKNDTSDRCEENDKEVQTRKSEADPLEGPSWLYNNKQLPSSEEEQKHRSNDCYVNFKRRKHRFAAVFDFVNGSNSLNSSKVKEEKPNLNKSNNLNNTYSITNNKDSKNSPRRSFSSPKENSNYERRSKSQNQSPGFIEETPPVKDECKSNESCESLTKIQLKQPVINLYDCMSDESVKNVSSRVSSQRNKSKKSDRNLENNSTLSIEGANTEVRKRRKAAPTNLSEPSLITKLRRS